MKLNYLFFFWPLIDPLDFQHGNLVINLIVMVSMTMILVESN